MSAARPTYDPRARRRLLYAFGFSAALHVSAVTIFNIVVYFPVSEIDYYDFRFVQAPRGSVGGEGQIALSEPTRWEWLPQLNPPAIENTLSDRLTLSNPGMDQQSLAEEIYGQEEESLSLLSSALDNLQTTVSRLTLDSNRDALYTTPPANGHSFAPASGMQGVILWPARDAPRPLLFSPPLQSVWDIEPRYLADGMSLTLRINAGGRVTRVWNDDLRSGPAIAALEAELANYRFAPDESARASEETARLVMRRQDAQP